MNTSRTRTSIAAALAAAVLALSAPQPAKADTTSTLLIGAAAAAGIFTAVNVSNKNAKANQVVGHTSSGNTVYADGHVISRNGQKYYPSDRGETLQCSNGNCNTVGSNGNYRGHRYTRTHYQN